MLRKEDPQELHQHEVVYEIAVLRLLQVFFLHEVHELTDQLRDQQIQRCRDEGYHYAKNYVFEEGEDEISE